MSTKLEITILSDAIDQSELSFYVLSANQTVFTKKYVKWENFNVLTAGLNPFPPAPTSTPGEAAAISFAFQINLHQNNLGRLSVTQSSNVVTIEALEDGDEFLCTSPWVDSTNLTISQVCSVPSNPINEEFRVDANILGQELTSSTTYCYLYEPLVATIGSNTSSIKKVFIDLEIISTEDGTIYENLSSYGEFELVPTRPIKVDLMQMARQYHDSKVYKIGLTSDITSAWEMVVSKYKYKFTVRCSDTSYPTYDILKLPIIGGRDYQDFTPLVLQSTPLDEATKFNLDLSNRFKDYPTIQTTLADPTATDSRPTITITDSTSGCKVEKAVIWKSALGGWMTWGFKLENKSYSHKYMGKLDVEIFESTQDIGGHIYKPVDYTGVDTTFSTTLKSLSLSSEELEAVSRIKFTPAAYYVTSDGKMELMRITNASTPLDSKANGGDFTLSLRSIGSVQQSTL